MAHPFPIAFFAKRDVITSPRTFTYASDGDINDIFYFLGTNLGVSSWVNPHTAGRCTWIRRSDPGGDAAISAMCDRAISYLTTDLSTVPPEWFAVDLGSTRTLVVTDYSMQNGSSGDFTNAPKNWKLQGSTSVATNDVAGVTAATWVDIDTRTNDTSIGQSSGAWGHFTLGSTPAAYRWFRVLATGVNQAGLNYLQIGEIQFYGVLTF